MDMHLNSSMTLDDEGRLAPRLLAEIGQVLDRLPVSYSLRIATAAGSEIRHSRIAREPGVCACAADTPTRSVPDGTGWSRESTYAVLEGRTVGRARVVDAR
jgi:hypothetical protein